MTDLPGPPLRPARIRVTDTQKLRLIKSAHFLEVFLPEVIRQEPELYQELLALYDMVEREMPDKVQAHLRQLVAFNKLKLANKF